MLYSSTISESLSRSFARDADAAVHVLERVAIANRKRECVNERVFEDRDVQAILHDQCVAEWADREHMQKAEYQKVFALWQKSARPHRTKALGIRCAQRRWTRRSDARVSTCAFSRSRGSHSA